ncbi:Replication factor A protein 2 [Grifola frondosa]|uniref:Replication factor A protein 2 n=1 Tax=Grifola frondosa TaxID=5627 RepID=A0A1C7MFX3_GRIFR|nr:Replication factor A protein 2 [Grifola frondosa]
MNPEINENLRNLRKSVVEGLRPVTIRQMTHATQAYDSAEFEIDGIEAHKVTTIAAIVDISGASNFIEYSLEDGTGGIKCRKWRDKFTGDIPRYEIGQYVRVVGEMSAWPWRAPTHLKMDSIREVSDPHEPYFHLLEAAFATLSYKCGPPPSSITKGLRRTIPTSANPERHSSPVINTAENIPPPIEPEQDHSEVMEVDPPHQRSPSPDEMEGIELSQVVERDPYSHLTVLQRGILLGILNAPPSEDGVHVSTIARGISRQGVTAEQVSDALDYLIDSGFIEPTIDRCHI